MSVLQKEIPQDWYATAFDGASAEMAWTERTESEIKRALTMLRPEGGERILDLACGTGRHSLELVRHGFSVVGVEIGPELIEIARKDAAEQGLEASSSRATCASSSSRRSSTSSSTSTTARSATSRPTRRTTAPSR